MASTAISIGMRFERLIVISPAEPELQGKYFRPRWLCRCDCGVEKIVSVGHLRSGHTRSCGCLVRNNSITHGCTVNGEIEPIYNVWSTMKARCLNPNVDNYQNYGGRGIRVCERWLSFENFLADMGRPPGPGYSLDRIDNGGNYEPDNCKWSTAEEQARNKRSNIIVEWQGQRMTLAEAARQVGANRSTVWRRVRRGWSPERALTT